MRRAALLTAGVLFAATANPAHAQEPAGRNWNIIGALGVMASSGGGTGTLMNERLPAMAGIRFRIEESPWWFGVEIDIWSAKATQAGFDSIVARSDGYTVPSAGRKATFRATTVGALVRRDLWRSSLVDLYAVGGIGATQSEGYVVGKCGSDFDGYTVCPEPPVYARSTGMAMAGSAGLGASVRYSAWLKPVPSWIRWALGERAIAELRVNSQQATEERFTSLIAQFGIGW